jgi:hypothetical protein
VIEQMSVLRAPDFLVVGSPRSGTTLVQRLACELPGVRMPPETHFFGFFVLDLMRRRRFPLEGAGLREELKAFAAMPKSVELAPDVDAMFEALEGHAMRPADMFVALVGHLAGSAETLGEKSPEHLLWWRPVGRAFPRLRFVAVVRDPRAVVSSARAVWGDRGGSIALRAERWAADQREVARALAALGTDRVLVLRYEDVVRDEAAARRTLGDFLRVPVPATVASSPGPSRFLLPREWWKQRALEPVTDDRIDVWREGLTPDEAAFVTSVCRRGMQRFGYAQPGRRLPVPARPSIREAAGRLRFRASRIRHLARINRVTL